MSARALKLAVDPIACDGHGLCSELFPERVALDDWGFPLVDGAPISDRLAPHARRAVAACPKRALRLDATAPPPAPGRAPSRAPSRRG